MILSKNNSISYDRNKLELFTYFYFIKKLIPFNLVEKYYGMNMENIGYKIKSIKENKAFIHKLFELKANFMPQ